MSSKIKVDTIENVAGSGNVSLGSGHNLVVPGDLTVDTNTLFVDASANKVAVGTNSPNTASSAASLQINKDGEALRIDGSANTAREIFFRGVGTSNVASIHSDGSLKLRAEDSGTHMEFHTADTLRMKIDSSGRITTPHRPAFLAYGSPTRDSLSGNVGHLHSFSQSNGSGYSYNVGSHYNNSTGRFTAPVAGKYYFYGSIYRAQSYTGGADQLLAFTKNNDNDSNLLSANAVGDQYEQITVSGVFHLAANDYVNFVIYAGSGSFTVQGSEPRNHFLGYLLG